MDLFGISGIDAAKSAQALSALALVVSLAQTFRKRGGRTPHADAALSEGELIAVISAAVAAESGMAPDGFRIAGIRAAWKPDGFSTPIWGHVERIIRTPFKA
jgi:hypothetical protein